MKCFLRGLLVLAALLVGAVLLIYLLAPAQVRMERSTVINAAPEAIFPKVNSLKEWRSWSPWIQREPDMPSTYEGPESGVGSKVSWTSETQGAGTQIITESVPNERIVCDLDFGEMGTAISDWAFVPDGDGTKVTWGMDVDAGKNIGKRIFNLFLDKMVGTDYEIGLANLKSEVEGG